MPSLPSSIVTVVLSVSVTTRPLSRVMLPTAVSVTLPSKLVGWSTVTMGVSVSVVASGAGVRLFCSGIAIYILS